MRKHRKRPSSRRLDSRRPDAGEGAPPPGPAAPRGLRLRATDPETARVVGILDGRGRPKGAGCLISATQVLTCAHLFCEDAAVKERTVSIELCGVEGRPRVAATFEKLGRPNSARVPDLALLTICADDRVRIPLNVSDVEFATPMRHSGKTYSVLGFPLEEAPRSAAGDVPPDEFTGGGGDAGHHSSGRLYGANAAGVVQMDSSGSLPVRGGFSGAPVWCPEVGAFVGIAVGAIERQDVAWCIPSRVLSAFVPELTVRFRIPVPDRPVVHDLAEDDPNIQLFGATSEPVQAFGEAADGSPLFGTTSADGSRRLKASVRRRRRHGDYRTHVWYECLGRRGHHGRIVTFITYPGFGTKGEDAYELFAELDATRRAEQSFGPSELFTVAAVGDAGETVLTLDLEEVARAAGES